MTTTTSQRTSPPATTQVVATTSEPISNEVTIEEKRKQNALAPLLQLPSELLLCIIHQYVAIYRRRTQRQLAGKLYTWLKITQICHHLRAVALADPTLWTIVSPTNPDFVRELLVRSQQTLLSYELGHIPPTEAGLISAQLMVESMDRVDSLKYLFSLSHYGKSPDLNCEAPNLRTLTIHNAEKSHPRIANLAPSFFKNAELPSLEKLDIALLPYASVQSMFRSTLHTLSISTCSMPGITSDLVEALRAMPLLEHLKLHQVLPETHSSVRPDMSSIPIVSLSQLRSLYVTRSSAVECADFLDRLSFPPSASLHLDLRPASPTLWCAVVIPALSAKFKDREPIQTVCIHTPWNTDVQVAAWSRAMDMDEFESQQTPPDLCITMYGHHSNTIECDETLVSLTCDLPLTGVKTLFIGELNPYLKRNSSWIAMFTPMTQTEILGVLGSTVEFISSVFHRPRERKPSSSGGGQTMPNLKCLSLRKVTFKEDIDAPTIYSYDFIHNLRNCLIVRNERHKRLESLRIRLAVNFTEDDLTVLQDLTETVDWDHQVNTQAIRNQWGNDSP